MDFFTSLTEAIFLCKERFKGLADTEKVSNEKFRKISNPKVGLSPISQWIMLILLLFLLTPSVSYGQSCPSDPNFDIPNPLDDPSCTVTAGDCTSKDLEVLGAFLTTGDECSTCEPGETITTELFLSIQNSTGSIRTSFAIFGNLEITDENGVVTNCPISRCSGPIPANSISTVSYGTITYTCGDGIRLTDVLLSWTDASPNSTCANHDCAEIAPKCGTAAEIVITPPLQASATASCIPGQNAIDVDLTVVGGEAPFTYDWDNDGTGDNDDPEDLFGVAPGTYTVLVTDANDCTVTATVTQAICCEFFATCNLDPGEQVIEGCDENDLPVAYTDPLDVFTGITPNPCGDLVLTYIDMPSGELCPGALTVVRTYTLFDDLNGNQVLDNGEESATCVENYRVEDTTDPVLSGVPSDVTVECDAVPSAATPTASDNCDADVNIVYEEVRTDGNCADNYTLTRTWTATDNCGNQDVQVQVITVEDTTDPVLSGVPSDVTVECDAVPSAATPTASDNCDADVNIAYEEVRTDGNCADNYTLTRTWTATDNCGNQDVQVQVITVEDTTDPVLSGVPSDVTVECDAVPSAATPTASDNCDADVNIAYEEVRTDGNCADNYTLTRTWTATDNCGNQDVQVQVITVEDTTDPVLSGVPSDVTVECDAVPSAATPTASDNCDADVNIVYEEVRTDGNCADNYTLTRTWTATDNCGNQDVQVQVITVEDTTDPVLSGVPSDVTVECDAVPSAATPTASDNCDADVNIVYEEVRTDGNCADNYTLTRTWTATDNCGNQDVQVQVITVEDTTDPVLSGVPSDVTVECDAVPSAATPTASDNCDADVNIAYEEVRTDGNCADNYTLTRTWTATDNCGNQDVQVQVITVEDTTDPVLSGVPSDVTVECDAVPSAATPTASDNCDADVNIAYEEVRTDGNCADNYTLTRTWTATDNCGNQDVQVQVITVEDTTDPVLSGVPSDVTVECDAVPSAATPTASDNCDADVNIAYEEVRTDGNCADNYTLTRTWTATDNCGNQDVQVQVITVEDTTDPVLSGVPSDVTVECDAVPSAATPTASDNCDADVNIVYEEVRTDGNCADNYTLTRTWTATDNCGNQDVQVQVITVEDTTDPVLSGVPSDVTVECDAVPSAATPTASDNCDADVNIVYEEVRTDGNCADNYTLTRTWTATDNCGNQDVQVQVITVEDTTDPVLSGVPSDVTVECDAVPSAATPTASDNCDADVNIVYEEVRTDGNCADNYTLTRTWTATDNCGNQDVQVQVITVEDTTDPVLSGVPSDVTVECDAVPSAATPTASDNCDADVNIVYEEVRTDGNCADNYTLTRTWTATDNCGNQDVQVQVITVEDTTDPVLSGVPSDVTVECDAVPSAATPTASDNCDADVNIVYEEVRTDGNCADNYTLTRTWTATDNCGNQDVQVQVITVEDTTDPVLSGVPSDVTVECDAVPSAATPTASDNCDADVNIVYEEVRTDGNCADNYTLTRTWTATDNCGNQDVQVQVITVEDTTDPVLSGVPSDVTVECDAVPSAATPTASDNCDADVNIVYEEVRTDGNCADNYTLTRTWTATDNCGNQDVQVQVITVEDTTDPVLSGVPSDVTVECDAVPSAATPTASDNCDADVNIVYEEVRTDGNCADNYTLTRTWTATDNCGNQDVQVQVITVEDTTDPVLSGVPSDVTVECDAVPSAATPTASDNCDADVNIVYEEVRTDGNCADNYTLTRTWTATDNCGNQDVQVQVITVEDTTDPVLSGVPSDVTVECDAVPSAATPTASDNCDADVNIVYEEVRTDGNCADNYTLTRTWTATDNCGNQDVQVQVITVEDTTDPVLSGVPSDVTVECDAVPSAATPTASDNCDADVNIVYEEVRTDGNCADNYTLTRTWTATDNCGNQDVQVQVITVEDTTDPVLSGVPSDVTVECDAVPSAATPTASDNCDADVNIVYEEVRTDGNCADNYTLTRTWTATDNCGNQDVQVQVITVEDTTDPVLSGVPSDVTVECDAVPSAATPTASDNCDADVNIVYEEVRTDGNCADNYTLTRTWTATDNCGNQDVQVQVITVEDTTDPVLSGVPSDVTVECDAVPSAATPTASDNCDADVNIVYEEVRTDGNCADNYTLTRTWTATDNCGNQDVQVQVITVEDTTDPVLSGVPSDVTVECDAVPSAATPTASDNCDADVNIVYEEVRTDGNCADNYTLTRTWTATDNCGNQDVQVQVITVEDTTDPVLSGVPSDVTVECDAVPSAATPTASDNCDADVNIVYEEVRTDGNCADNYTLTRTWTATDNCGNQDVQVQVITVEDTTDPVLSGVPSDVTVECDAVPSAATPTASDNCDADVNIVYEEVRTDGNCADNYTLTRTWTATDNCGNQDVQVQVITVEDTTDPVLSGVPSDVTVECDAVPSAATPTASDNCDADVNIAYEEVRTDGNCADNYTLTRTWTATDNCGNQDVQVQVITVEDTTDPVLFGVPADVIVECDMVPDPAMPTASDNCDNGVVIYFNEEIQNQLGTDCYTIVRTWTATDNCGNQDVEIQVITVQDTENPVFTYCPPDITVSCNEIPEVDTPVATDNCDTDVNITYLGESDPISCGFDSYQLVRTWQAEDNCGNTAICEQVITVDTSVTDDCLSLVLTVDYDPIANTTTYTWVLGAEDCPSALSHIAFEMPLGVVAIEPADNTIYSYPGNSNDYNVENPSGGGKGKNLYSIRFETIGEGIKDGTETFVYTLPGEPMDEITVEGKGGRRKFDIVVDVENCAVCSDTSFARSAGSGNTTLAVQNEPVQSTTIETYPVPFENELNLKVNISYEAKVNMELFDLRGRLIHKSDERAVVPGVNVLRFSLDRLPSELYILRLNTGKEIIMKKVLSRK